MYQISGAVPDSHIDQAYAWACDRKSSIVTSMPGSYELGSWFMTLILRSVLDTAVPEQPAFPWRYSGPVAVGRPKPRHL